MANKKNQLSIARTNLFHALRIQTLCQIYARYCLALLLRDGQVMEWMCDHCLALFAGVPYRVKSEESGVVLLDMIVCHYCYIEARKLGLRTEGPGISSTAESQARQ
jgi:hypothetical protein